VVGCCNFNVALAFPVRIGDFNIRNGMDSISFSIRYEVQIRAAILKK